MSTPASAIEVEEPGRPLSPTNTKPQRSRATTIIRNAQETFNQSRPPVGMFHAFGNVGSNIPTMNDIQTGNYKPEGWSGPAQRRNSLAPIARQNSFAQPLNMPELTTMETITEPKTLTNDEDKKKGIDSNTLEAIPTPQPEKGNTLTPHDPHVPYDNGYQFPPKHTKMQATTIALHGSWKFVTTPFGFVLTLYALNIVAWGGMLFLILCHAAPAMGKPSYNDINSPAKKWLEIDSQILNALFCVTGLGLIPWRFRDFWYLLQWRIKGDESALRRLAGIHRNWFRLQGSESIDVLYHPSTDDVPADVNQSRLALPIAMSPDAPLTGERASPSTYWLMDFVVWGFVINTLLQIVLCGMMWGFNRYNRPSWSVGLLISLACIVASAAGWVIFKEGKRVKKVEGVPVSEEDMKLLKEMREREGQSV